MVLIIDGHVSSNSNRRLPVIVCRPRKTNFRFPFPFAANKQRFAVFVFCLQHTNRSCRILLVPLSACRIPETCRHEDGDIETWRHRDGEMETWRNEDMETWRNGHGTWMWHMETSNGKQKLIRFSLIRLLFVHPANGSLSFVRLLTKKTNGGYSFTNWLNGLAHLWFSSSVKTDEDNKTWSYFQQLFQLSL